MLYLIPQTSVLGAVLLTGYLGGAIATHVRIGEPVYSMSSSAFWFGWGFSWRRRPLACASPFTKVKQLILVHELELARSVRDVALRASRTFGRNCR